MKNIALLLLSVAVFASCQRQDCETATVKGKVQHHALDIPDAMVYIKKGSKDAPSDPRNPKSYDDSVKADANAAYSFSNLKDGDYYLFSIGFDAAIGEAVFGGRPLTVPCKSTRETINQNIAVV
jgi:hypothetical protein